MPFEVVDRDPEHGTCRLPAQGGGQFVGQRRFPGRRAAVDPHACRVIQPQGEDPVGQPAEHLLPHRGHESGDVRGWIGTGKECRANAPARKRFAEAAVVMLPRRRGASRSHIPGPCLPRRDVA
ncbi:hypothetical protein [Actinoplanes sp. NPDC089786]|uniref:hypothetical protein n=1 Tax=Actinoplanes sp. NPDC089786 TaxID=3155185 RepID=UPI00342EBA80